VHEKYDLKQAGVPIKPITEKPKRYRANQRPKTDLKLLVEEEEDKRDLSINHKTWEVVLAL
jgi:hypothetical protein